MFRSPRVLRPLLPLLGVVWLLGCTVDVTGAICTSDDNCPSGQRCSAEGRCGLGGATGGGSGGGSSADGGTGGGSGGGSNDDGGTGGGTGGGTSEDGGTGGGAGADGGVCGDGGVNTANDPANCGSCGHVCATPAHASATCRQSACGRGPCANGFFDVDGPATFGCESTCSGRTCTFPDGGTVTVSNVPVPESRLAEAAVSNGAGVQSDGAHVNTGTVGQVTPAVDGGLEVRNAQYRHRGGLSGSLP
jgi:hypothetical protein